MRIVIDGTEFTENELNEWKKRRIKKVLRNLKSNIIPSDNIDMLNAALTTVKMGLSYNDITCLLKKKLAFGEWGMKVMSALSKERRSKATTTIYADGISAAKLSAKLDRLMVEPTEEYKKVNLTACPDHYVLMPRNGILEVIETTGNSPVPTQFFITFDDETGLKEPRDLSYTHQSTGVAKLKDGTIIGGVRHQFKDTPTGIEARLLVEFPAICPKWIIKEHQKHLAAEWSSWIKWITNHQEL